MIMRCGPVLAVALALAACGGSADAPTTTEGGDAQGEVQGGTISDAMLATDAVKSQSPSLKPSPSEGAGGGGSDSEDSAEAAEPEEPAEPAAAAAPEEAAEEG